MTPEQLKASILQYAIQGKLTLQTASENAQDLICGLKEKKAELVKKKVIKTEKPLPDINEEEVPFDIPDNWEWCYCQDIFFAHSAMRIHQSDWKSEGIPFFRGRELVRLAKTGDPNAEIYITEEFYTELKEKGGVPKKDDILITAVGTLGKVYVVQGTKRFYYKDAYILCLDNYGVDPYYIKYLVESPYCQNYIYGDDAYGTTVAQLTLEKLKKLTLPIPPLEEQHRIVAKIEELLPYVDRYAEAYEKLEQFNAKFPEDMKKSILQYAIQGKLVEQKPEEGTAEELYQKIQKDREQRIKNGEIRRDKRASLEGVEVEKPFDIPDSWKWVTLGSILLKLTDGTHKTPKYTESGIKFVSVKDMSSGVLSLENTKFISPEEHEELFSRCDPQKGDMLLSKVGTTGVPAIIDTDEEFSLFVSVALLKYNNSLVDRKFLYYLLQSPLVQLQAAENTRGVGNKNWVLDAIGKTLIVLPPYQEQCRIVFELERLLPYCDQLIKK